MSNNGCALVTGSAKRIGKRLALGLADMGYNIALHYRSSKDEAEELQQDIASRRVKCRLFQADFMNPDDVKNLIPTVSEAFPDLAILINNVSI